MKHICVRKFTPTHTAVARCLKTHHTKTQGRWVDYYTALAWWLHDCQWGMKHDPRCWLVSPICDCLSRYRLGNALVAMHSGLTWPVRISTIFFKGHWQPPCIALITSKQSKTPLTAGGSSEQLGQHMFKEVDNWRWSHNCTPYFSFSTAYWGYQYRLIGTDWVHKQRVLMHRHQRWNVRHGLCHIYMRYIYIWVVYSFCLFCCLFIIVTWWYIWCIVWQVASKRKYRHVW